MIRATIVIPSFNQAAYLDQAIESVLAQRESMPDLEVLVYDAGSTDGSLEIIQRHADSLNYWQSQPDGGQAAALRAGFERSSGEVLGWVNSDDVLLPGAVEVATNWLDEHPEASAAYGDAAWIDESGKVIKLRLEIDFDWKIFAYGYCYIPQPATFFRRRSYEDVGGIDDAMICAFDYDLWHRLSNVGEIGHIAQPLAAMRDHPGTKTNRLRRTFARERRMIRERYMRATAIEYAIRHPYERLRRILKRRRQGRYQKAPMSDVRSLK